MREILHQAGTYAGELIIAGVALIIRTIEKRAMIRRNRKKWESGETYSRFDDTAGNQSKR